MPKQKRQRNSSQGAVEIHVTSEESQTTSCTVTSHNVTSGSTNSLFLPSFEMLDLLKDVNAAGVPSTQGDLFSFKNLCFYLKEYIKLKQLWDEFDATRVHCGNDKLGKVFGVDTFTITEAPLLLRKSCILVSDPHSSPARKRSAVDALNIENIKKRHTDMHPPMKSPTLEVKKKTYMKMSPKNLDLDLSSFPLEKSASFSLNRCTLCGRLLLDSFNSCLCETYNKIDRTLSSGNSPDYHEKLEFREKCNLETVAKAIKANPNQLDNKYVSLLERKIEKKKKC